jgi:hypothetical protein
MLADMLRQGGLDDRRQRLFDQHPRIAGDLLANIPRLDEVAAIIRFQEKRYDGSGPPPDGPSGQDIPLGSRLLKVALDYDTLICSGFDKARALAALRERSGWYDPRVFEAFATLAKSREGFNPLSEVARGSHAARAWCLAGDLTVDGGVVASGTIVDQELLSRLKRPAIRLRTTVAVYAPLKWIARLPARSELRTCFGRNDRIGDGSCPIAAGSRRRE